MSLYSGNLIFNIYKVSVAVNHSILEVKNTQLLSWWCAARLCIGNCPPALWNFIYSFVRIRPAAFVSSNIINTRKPVPIPTQEEVVPSLTQLLTIHISSHYSVKSWPGSDLFYLFIFLCTQIYGYLLEAVLDPSQLFWRIWSTVLWSTTVFIWSSGYLCFGAFLCVHETHFCFDYTMFLLFIWWVCFGFTA